MPTLVNYEGARIFAKVLTYQYIQLNNYAVVLLIVNTYCGLQVNCEIEFGTTGPDGQTVEVAGHILETAKLTLLLIIFFYTYSICGF